MRNAVLHLITNKKNNFGLEGLPTTSNYTPFVPTEAEDKIREALFINSSAYHLVNSLTAAYTFEEILAEFNESERTYELYALPRISLTVTGASYANTSEQNFNVAFNPDFFIKPNNLNWSIKYNTTETLDLNYAGKITSLPYTVDSNKILSAEWPADSGIKGGFQIPADKEWSLGSLSTIAMTVPPISFPYSETIDFLKRFYSSYLYTLLNEYGLSRNFLNAQSGIEQYALVLLALAKPGIRNPKVSSC